MATNLQYVADQLCMCPTKMVVFASVTKNKIRKMYD